MIVWFKIKQKVVSSRYHEKSNYSKTRPKLKNPVGQMEWIDELFNMFFSDFKNIENWTNDIGLNWFSTLKYDSKNTFYEIYIENLINKYCFIIFLYSTCSQLQNPLFKMKIGQAVIFFECFEKYGIRYGMIRYMDK